MGTSKTARASAVKVQGEAKVIPDAEDAASVRRRRHLMQEKEEQIKQLTQEYNELENAIWAIEAKYAKMIIG